MPTYGFSLDDVEIVDKNFSGLPDEYYPQGRRSFGIIIRHEDVVHELIREGWRFACIPAVEDEAPDLHNIRVELQYDSRPPVVVIKRHNGNELLTEREVYILDDLDLMYADVDVRAVHWTHGEVSGIKAVLRTLSVAVDE